MHTPLGVRKVMGRGYHDSLLYLLLMFLIENRFLWVKFKEMPTRWPAQVMEQSEDGLTVYVKSDNAL